MDNNQTSLKQVAAFSEPYRDRYLESVDDAEPEEDPFRLRFFLKKAMAGARHESTNEAYRKAAEKALKEHQQRIECWLEGDAAFPDTGLEHELKQAGLTNSADRQMVVEVVDFLSDLPPDYGIVDYTVRSIEAGDIETVYDDLTGIHNIAQKKAALFLRDVVTVWNLESDLSWNEYQYVFPVDTRVRQVLAELGIIGSDVNRDQLIDTAIRVCKPEVSPVALNQGAWYLGANAFEVAMDNLEELAPSS